MMAPTELDFSEDAHTSSAGTKNKSHDVPDWSNDWHPIIMNKSNSPDCRSGFSNCTELGSHGHLEDEHMMNNAIDYDGERRRSRHLSPIMLLPLSRAIEPRPVVLRTSRHMPLPPEMPDHHGMVQRRPIQVEPRLHAPIMSTTP
jgi:hypothetical protein